MSPFFKEHSYQDDELHPVDFEYPFVQEEKFCVSLLPVDRKQREKLMKQATPQQKGFRVTPEINTSLYHKALVKEAFAGWKGLTAKVAENLALIKPEALSTIPSEGISYDVEDAAYLLDHNATFKLWIDECLDQYEIWNKAEKERRAKNLPTG